MSDLAEKLHPCPFCRTEPYVDAVMGEACRIYCPACDRGVTGVHYGEARTMWQRFSRRLVGLWADTEEVAE